jgi:hypothetical protein
MRMKTKFMALGTAVLFWATFCASFGASFAAAQSVADAARAARKNKAGSAPASRHFDNENLPSGDGVSVVGPAPSSETKATDENKAAADAAAATAAASDRQKAADEWKEKLDKQKAKIDSLNHELDLDQREMRLRAAAAYSDPAVRGRNAAEWDKQDAQYRTDIESKQKAIEEARKQLDDMQEQARKAGIKEKDADSDKK